MRRLSLRFCAVCVTVLLVLLAPVAVMAHGILLRSTPVAHGTVSAAGFPVELHFNVRVDGARSKVSLTTRKDPSKTFPLAVVKQAAPDTLATSSAAVAPGEYALHWVVLSSDGHITQGEILFTAK